MSYCWGGFGNWGHSNWGVSNWGYSNWSYSSGCYSNWGYSNGWCSTNYKPWSWSCKPVNNPPVACDDEQVEICAPESVEIDVLANDYDRQDETSELSIEINGTVLENTGDVVTLANGATITLTAEHTLSYASNGAYASLKVGESAIQTVTYKVIDTDGAKSGAATFSVEVNGAIDTYEEIADSLPDDISFTMTGFDGNSDADLKISSSDSRFDGLDIDSAYCLVPTDDFERDIVVDSNIYAANPDDVTDGIGFNEDNLDLISWVMNQDFTNQDNGDGTNTNYTQSEVQTAIWQLASGTLYQVEGAADKKAALANVREIIKAANDNGEGYVPGAGDLVTFVLNPTEAAEAATGHEQPFIFGVRFEDLVKCVTEPSEPDCPSTPTVPDDCDWDNWDCDTSCCDAVNDCVNDVVDLWNDCFSFVSDWSCQHDYHWC